MRTIIVAMLALLLGACASAPPPLPPPPTTAPVFDHLIVPGKRIGPVSIGMSAKQLLDALGAPKSTYRFTDASSNEFSNGIEAVVDDATLQVWRVQVQLASPGASAYATAEGVGMGLTDLEIRARLGNPDSVETINELNSRRYCYPGLAIETDQGKSARLSVYVPGGACR
jgi:hypothetical protein